jgi:hypothetical protein
VSEVVVVADKGGGFFSSAWQAVTNFIGDIFGGGGGQIREASSPDRNKDDEPVY